MTSLKITFRTAPMRRKPKLGDTKMIKGVLHVRELKYVEDRHGGRIGLDCTGGKQRYIWIPKNTP